MKPCDPGNLQGRVAARNAARNAESLPGFYRDLGNSDSSVCRYAALTVV
jgi:hypothetical protein